MTFAIMLSGGTGQRMGTTIKIPKQYIETSGKPIVCRTLQVLQDSPKIDVIVIVAAKEWHGQIHAWNDLYGMTKDKAVVTGGDSRQESIFQGLKACARISLKDDDVVIIHDAVRPLVSEKLIEACLAPIPLHEGCMPVLPLKDTVYVSDDGKHIDQLLDRNLLYAGQAPEAFLLVPYFNAHQNASQQELHETKGSSEIAFKKGLDVCMIPGDEANFKITTTKDLEHYEAILASKSN